MTYIKTGIKLPGIVELLFYKGSTGKALSNLAQTLLHGPSPLTPGEREIIAAHVSKLHDCEFCYESHRASANAHLLDNGMTIKMIETNISNAPVSNKMKSLLKIAAQVQKSGREVTQQHIEDARLAGANDEEIHDTVLVAAAFCMFNRYVDGLRTNLPADKSEYVPMGEQMANKGYKYPPLFLRKFVLRKINRNQHEQKRA
jgi:uncharacterized peroxidase-related enzyme